MSTIPNEKQARVNVSANESVDSATINRSSTRLLANDLKLRDYLCNVLSTNFTDGLSGSISLVSGGVVGIRPDFLTAIDLTQILSGFSLDDLADLEITSPSDGESLIFDANINKWVNDVPEFSFIVSGTFIEEIEYVTGFSHTNGIDGSPSANITSHTNLDFSFPISGFSGGSAPIEDKNIAGFFIYAQNWGRINADEGDQTSGGGAKWETQVQYPDGNYYPINGYRALNSDDDGGVQTTILVPFDGNCQTELRVRLSLRNADITLQDDQQRRLNYFELVAISQVSAAKDLTPDVSFEHIKGSVQNEDITALADGDIVAGTLIEAPHLVWSSINPGTTLASWTNIFPIIAPSNASKTEIEFTGFLGAGGTTSLDIGSEGSSTGIARGTIVINWLTKVVEGTMMYFGGGLFDSQGGAILSGSVGGTPLQFVDDGFGGLDIKSQILVTHKRIKSLPIVVSVANNTLTSNVAYKIRHYNTIAGGGGGDLETFVGTTTGNTITHNLSKTPDIIMCLIDGQDINNFDSFHFTQKANGTDGGLKYTFAHYHPEITATSTQLTINLAQEVDNGGTHPTRTFPAGTRTFTAIIL